MVYSTCNPHKIQFEAFVAGGASKILAQLSTYPFSVVRSRLQEQRSLRNADTEAYYKGLWDTLSKIAKNEGISGFFKGLGPSLARMAMNSAFFFLFFEHIKQALTAVPQFRNS